MASQDFSNNLAATSTATEELIARPSTAIPVAFRRCGKIITDATNVGDVISQINADFTVDKQPIIKVSQAVIDAIKEGRAINDLIDLDRDLITSHVATVRQDTSDVLGVVSPKYGVVQNTRAFEFINFIKEIAGEEPQFQTAGTLGNGERLFVTAKLGSDMFIGNKDRIENYIVFTNSHDGKGAVMAFFTPIRVVCQNTLAMAIAGCQNKLVFRHTSGVNERISAIMHEDREKALKVFNANHIFSEKFVNAMLNLKDQKVSEKQMKDFAARMTLTDENFKLYLANESNLNLITNDISTRSINRMNALIDSIESGIGQDEHRGTKLWLLNGITTFLHNETKYDNAEFELLSMNEGTAAKKTQQAYDFLLAA